MSMGSPRNSDELREIHADPGEMVLYAWKNVLVFVWLRDASVELMRRLSLVLTTHTREVGSVSLISIVTEVSDLPDETKRKAYKDIVTTHAASFAYVTFVLEREGFIGSAIRGLMTGMLMFTGKQHILHVASTAEQAAAWLAPKHGAATGVQFEAEELLRVLREARTRATGRPSPVAGA